MTFVRHIAPALLATALALGAGPALAQAASHQGHAAGGLALSLDAGRKWQGDENMRKGMQAIRDEFAARIDAIHEDRLPAGDYRALAATVTAQADFMIENCQLEPAADEQLHIVLARAIEGASEMEAGAEPRAGAVAVVEALDAYGAHFEHPGWQPLD